MITVVILIAVALLILGCHCWQLSYNFREYVRILEHESQSLRDENSKLKLALFPQLRAVGAGNSTAEPQMQRKTPQVPAVPASTVFNSRLPFRLKFRNLVREHNTQQIGRDRMAAAISQEKVSNG